MDFPNFEVLLVSILTLSSAGYYQVPISLESYCLLTIVASQNADLGSSSTKMKSNLATASNRIMGLENEVGERMVFYWRKEEKRVLQTKGQQRRGGG